MRKDRRKIHYLDTDGMIPHTLHGRLRESHHSFSMWSVTC